ncbi:unnamed protein product [Cyprideis torosa]|uniref:Uncharacterized protein n=1 Tax=Cyprideis torosa TaxID=163714 RepID=A0A7R8WEW0_9CRUS|nr:unnamed protein product [Cyprideis torosa]CAG0896301.1 unnamed protein product [Cyprideis torosa]
MWSGSTFSRSAPLRSIGATSRSAPLRSGQNYRSLAPLRSETAPLHITANPLPLEYRGTGNLGVSLHRSSLKSSICEIGNVQAVRMPGCLLSAALERSFNYYWNSTKSASRFRDTETRVRESEIAPVKIPRPKISAKMSVVPITTSASAFSISTSSSSAAPQEPPKDYPEEDRRSPHPSQTPKTCSIEAGLS